MNWYILLVQYVRLTDSTGKQTKGGEAWDYVFVQADSPKAAVEKFTKEPKCCLKAFSIGPNTTTHIHRVEDLDEAMEAKDVTPKRRRKK